MKHKIIKVDDKSKDWKVVSIEMPDGNVLVNVSVNRTNKKGEVFPDFDAIVPDALIDGELWESGASKWYLFAPKQRPARSPGAPAAIAQAQSVKREDIAAAQERKNGAIHKAGAMRDATLVALASIKDIPFPDDSDFKAIWQSWYKYFLGIADQPF